MRSVELQAEALQRQMERVLGSPGFVRNERLSRFLEFVVERHTEGRGSELKESVLGVEVFGRKPGYNPKIDPIVRTEARRLRARLKEYYDDTGASDSVVIELPKGGYVPVIRTTPPAFSAVQRSPYRLWSGIGIGLIILLCAILGWTRFGPARRRGTGNAQAYNLYLHARAFEMRPAVRGVEQSIDLFEQAIARDPSFAPAYAGVAAGQAARSAFDRFDSIKRRDIIAKGWAAAEKAIQLDARSADAQDALGMMQARQAQWEQAQQSFQRAIGIAPRDPLWRDHFAFFFLLPLGRTEEALRQLRVAEELDPLSPLTHHALSLALRSAGRFDEAEFHCKRSAENDRQSSGCWAETLLRQGNAGQAIRILEETWSGRLLEMGAESLGVAYARAGRREDAERIAAIVPRPASKAAIFAALADKDLTFAMLDKMVPMGPTRVGRDVLINRDFAFLRGDLRLKTLRRKVGLPE